MLCWKIFYMFKFFFVFFNYNKNGNISFLVEVNWIFLLLIYLFFVEGDLFFERGINEINNLFIVLWVWILYK